MTGDRDAAARYLENWQDEVDSAAEYRTMAAAEPDPRLAKVYANLAAMEEAHIAFWEQHLRDAGATVPPRRVSWRSRVLNAIARRLGPDLVLATIAAKEEVDQNVYVGQSETAGTRMPAQERWHAKVLKELVTSQPRGVQGSFLARLEGRHRSVGGNALRAAVLGANDGLCSNLSLVMGVAGASVDSHGLLVTGLAGLLAGACSAAPSTRWPARSWASTPPSSAARRGKRRSPRSCSSPSAHWCRSCRSSLRAATSPWPPAPSSARWDSSGSAPRSRSSRGHR